MITFPNFRAAIGNAAQGVVDSVSSTYFEGLTAVGCGMNANNQQALIDFVAGCVADAIWDDIKTVVPLAGPSCFAGVLVPLKGVAPTNFNFDSGDYVVNTGLKGNGTTKYLDSNETALSIGGQNDSHMACYTTSALMQSYLLGNAGAYIYRQLSAGSFSMALNGDFRTVPFTETSPSFQGVRRNSSSGIVSRVNGSEDSWTNTSVSPNTGKIHVFRNSAVSGSGYSSSRCAFYSLGTSLNLGKLRTRMVNYVSALTT